MTHKSTSGGYGNGTATLTWDTLKKGLLTAETQNGVTRAYTYTGAMQLATTTVTVSSSVGGDNSPRVITNSYDSFYGRAKGLSYPNGLALEYKYNTTGYLEKTQNASTGYVYREITHMNAKGQLLSSNIANNKINQASVYNSDGTMANTVAHKSLSQIHGHYYEVYDDFLNIKSERNSQTGLNKSYQYDNLNRLTHYSFSHNGAFNTMPYNSTTSYAYDALGNLLKKTDYSANNNSAYKYTGSGSCATKPNAICSLIKLNGTTVNYTYDNRGNLTSGDGLTTLRYNALDKPVSVIGRAGHTTFV